ncbi:MAG: Rrf2 family transcriptional regulator [Planctomycetota bacterium]
MLSSTAEYALRSIMHLTSHPGTACTSKEIAESGQIPGGYVSKVMQDLVGAGIVESQRGPNGGFRLAREPGAITVLEVVNAVDPIRRIVACPLRLPEHGSRLCQLHQQLDDAIASFERILSEATFADLTREGKRSSRCQFPTVERGAAKRKRGK